jgi:hypothetical protein
MHEHPLLCRHHHVLKPLCVLEIYPLGLLHFRLILPVHITESCTALSVRAFSLEVPVERFQLPHVPHLTLKIHPLQITSERLLQVLFTRGCARPRPEQTLHSFSRVVVQLLMHLQPSSIIT